MRRHLPSAILAILAVLAAGTAYAQEGPVQGQTFSSSGRPAAGVNIAICQRLTTTAAAVANNVATLTFGSNPQTQGFVQGFPLVVSGFTGGDTYFNGNFTISAVSSSTISFALTHANASASSNGVVYMTGSSTQACAALIPTFTDYTGNFSSPNPFTSDGLGNYTNWAAPGNFLVQLYGPTVTTTVYQTSVPCVLNSVCGGGSVTPPVTLTASVDTMTPLTLQAHSATQSKPVLDIQMNPLSSTADAPVTIRGFGLGKWSQGGGTALVHFIADAPAGQAPVGWFLSNIRSGFSGGGAPLGAMAAICGDTGICTLNGGGGDANGDYGPITWGLSGDITISNSENNNNIAANLTVQSSQSVTTHDIFHIKGTSAVLSGADYLGNWFWNGSTSGTAKIGVAAIAGTPNKINLPTSTGSVGQILTTDGNNPQQTSWQTPTSFSCAYQGPLGAVTGTGAAATYYTCAVPALAAGTGISITIVSKHTTGTANIAYTVQFGGTSTTSSTPTGSANQIEVIKCLLMNNPASTTAQTVTTTYMDSNAGSNVIKLDTMAINTTSAQTLNIQFNVANTDQITPEQFAVQLVQ